MRCIKLFSEEIILTAQVRPAAGVVNGVGKCYENLKSLYICECTVIFTCNLFSICLLVGITAVLFQQDKLNQSSFQLWEIQHTAHGLDAMLCLCHTRLILITHSVRVIISVL